MRTRGDSLLHRTGTHASICPHRLQDVSARPTRTLQAPQYTYREAAVAFGGSGASGSSGRGNRWSQKSSSGSLVVSVGVPAMSSAASLAIAYERAPNARTAKKTMSKKFHHRPCVNAARSPMGTTPSPNRNKPIKTPMPPQISKVFRSPSIHRVIPNRYEARYIPQAAGTLVLESADNGKSRTRLIANVHPEARTKVGRSLSLRYAAP